MGQKYTSQSASGYNASAPADDGSTVAANKVTWLTIKTKLSDVLKTFIEAVNTALVTALDTSASTTSINYTTLATDHLKPIEVTAAITISLGDAATMGAGYQVTVRNKHTAACTVGVITSANTLNGLANGSVSVPPGGAMTFGVNQAVSGYGVLSTAGIRAVKRKTADESVTSSTVLQDDDHLTFAIAANEEWCVEFYLKVGAVIGTTGFKVAVNAPALATVDADATCQDDNLHSLANPSQTIAGAMIFSAGNFSGGGNASVRVTYSILNGANAGNVTLQWAQNTSSGTAVTLRKGSFMVAERVA